ncbi:MAG TPA: hypothetical protein VFC63_10355 [Blastocatellia bacterium]|nr:hypothetical protein [Blastocatellia bacterium]
MDKDGRGDNEEDIFDYPYNPDNLFGLGSEGGGSGGSSGFGDSGSGDDGSRNKGPVGFDGLLLWLGDGDRDAGAVKYENIRRGLIQKFISRGCPVAEDLADDTFDRVIKLLPKVVPRYKGQPASYIFRVSHYIYLEYLRYIKNRVPMPQDIPQPRTDPDELPDEATLGCQRQCLSKLKKEDRELYEDYNSEEKGSKIENRKRLAEETGLGENALRIKVHRIRKVLRKCITACMSGKGGDNVRHIRPK